MPKTDFSEGLRRIKSYDTDTYFVLWDHVAVTLLFLVKQYSGERAISQNESLYLAV